MTTVLARPSADEIERNVKAGYWYPRGLPDLFLENALKHPEKELVIDRNGRHSYGKTLEAVRRLAHALKTNLGVKKHEVVLVQMPNWWEGVVIHLALEAIDAVAVPLPPMFRAPEVGYIAELTGAVCAFYPASFGKHEYSPMYTELALPKLRSRVLVGSKPAAGAPEIGFDALLETPAPGPADAPFGSDPDQVMEIGFTNGSTGKPKGAVHTSNTLTREQIVWGNANRLGPNDVWFIPTTIGHQMGYSNVRAAILFDAKMVLLERWEAERGTEVMATEKTTFAITTPAFLFDVLNSKKLREVGGLPSMHHWVLAGQVVTAELNKEAVAKFPGCKFTRQFGMTEIGSMVINDLTGPPEKELATGIVMPGAHLKVLDEDLKEVPRGQTGELALKAPSCFLGYYGLPEVTAACFTPDGFFRTGDEVRVDEDDWVWVTGRLKDLIKRGGESISPAEIEEILAAHPKLADSTVVGSPDERLGERICVFAVAKPGETVTLQELVDFVAKSGIARAKYPERLILVDDIPRTSIGKVHKQILRKQAANTPA